VVDVLQSDADDLAGPADRREERDIGEGDGGAGRPARRSGQVGQYAVFRGLTDRGDAVTVRSPKKVFWPKR